MKTYPRSRVDESVRVVLYIKVGWSRYADHFIIGVNNPATLPIVRLALVNFLGVRGLKLSDDNTKSIHWSIGNKFDFLSWTFHFIKPVCVNWIIRAPRKAVGKHWLSVYPSRNATKSLRSRIKAMTSPRQRNAPLGTPDIQPNTSFNGMVGIFLTWRKTNCSKISLRFLYLQTL